MSELQWTRRLFLERSIRPTTSFITHLFSRQQVARTSQIPYTGVSLQDPRRIRKSIQFQQPDSGPETWSRDRKAICRHHFLRHNVHSRHYMW